MALIPYINLYWPTQDKDILKGLELMFFRGNACTGRTFSGHNYSKFFCFVLFHSLRTRRYLCDYVDQYTCVQGSPRKTRGKDGMLSSCMGCTANLWRMLLLWHLLSCTELLLEVTTEITWSSKSQLSARTTRGQGGQDAARDVFRLACLSK